jgi:hypothetical protein
LSANTVVASAARTANGTSAAYGLGPSFPLGQSIALEIEVTAVSGTSPSMALSVLWSEDGVNFGLNDGSADTFAAITAVGNVVKTVPARAPYMQLSWVLTGTTPSFTFSALQSGMGI